MMKMDSVKVKKWQSFKHELFWNSTIGNLYRNAITKLGIKLMKIARACFRYTCGRCSWCGKPTGLGHINSKGHRCDTHIIKPCYQQAKD